MQLRTKKLNQTHLTGECWSVQIWGLTQCKKCPHAHTKDCGGRKIRKLGKNAYGYTVPLGGE